MFIAHLAIVMLSRPAPLSSRLIATRKTGLTHDDRTVLLCNEISLLSTKAGNGIAAPVITDVDIKNITQLAKKKNAFDILSQSLAPSIWGHEYIKKAVLLMLLGGVEKNLDNGTHIRG